MRIYKRRADFLDLTGKRFDRYAVVRFVGRRYPNGTPPGYKVWFCVCECGSQREVAETGLLSGRSGSCGCKRIERVASRLTIGSEKDHCLRRIFTSYRPRARKLGVKFTLTLQDFANLVMKDCHYCGCPPSNLVKSQRAVKWARGFQLKYNGLDRIAPDRGYVPGNVVPCCIDCNRAKHAMGVDRFFAWLERAYQHSLANRVRVA